MTSASFSKFPRSPSHWAVKLALPSQETAAMSEADVAAPPARFPLRLLFFVRGCHSRRPSSATVPFCTRKECSLVSAGAAVSWGDPGIPVWSPPCKPEHKLELASQAALRQSSHSPGCDRSSLQTFYLASPLTAAVLNRATVHALSSVSDEHGLPFRSGGKVRRGFECPHSIHAVSPCFGTDFNPNWNSRPSSLCLLLRRDVF